MNAKRRARSGEEKAEKSRAILDAARRLLEARDYAEITMADIAKEAKEAKGTLFLYFKSKEELFLALTVGYFEAFFADLEVAIAQAAGKGSGGILELLPAMTRHIGDDPGFLKMIVLLGPIIERNADYEKILAMKRFMLERMSGLGAALESLVPGMEAGAGLRFFLRLYGVAVGYLTLANPAACAKYVLENEEFAALRFDFREEFEETAAALLKGMI